MSSFERLQDDRHATAQGAGDKEGWAEMIGRKGIRRCALAAVLAAGLLVPALAAAPASAEQVVQHEYLGESFNGGDSSGGEFGNRIKEINVNDATHNVYVTTDGCSACGVNQFDSSGHAKSFTYPLLGGSSTLTVPPGPYQEQNGYTTVDNSGTATQGRIYVVAGEKVYAFNPDGSPILGYPISVRDARGVAVNPTTGNLWVAYSSFGTGVSEYRPSGEATGREYRFSESGFTNGNMGIDSEGNIYLLTWTGAGEHVIKYNENGEELYPLDPSAQEYDASLAVSPTSGRIYVGATQEGIRKIWEYNSAGTQIASFGSPTPGLAGIRAVGVDGSNEKVFVGSAEPSKRVDVFPTGGTLDIPGVVKGGATGIEGNSATIHGSLDPDGIETTSCKFEWGPNPFYGQTVSCSQGENLNGNGAQDVSAEISGLSKGQTYHYRLIVANANGKATGADGSFVQSARPIVTDEYVSEVHADQALVHATVNPEGVPATFHVEYGTEECESASCESSEELSVGTGTKPIEVSFRVTGLADGTRYHYRVVATNQSGPTPGADETFTTFPTTESVVDHCPNAHVRQQTGAALLLDCRAYELVSAGNTGGYNVESDLVAGQTPYDGYPEASPVLYAIRSGAIPGAGPAANRGRDPYVATRGSEGWTTKYVGVPSDNPYSTEAFGSELLEADPGLSTFAFGGAGICSPCFADGSTNIPLRLPNGELVEGIGAAANPAGHIGRYLSADGEHLVFGSTTKLATGGNQNGDVSIYERDLPSGATRLVSTDSSGATLAGEGIAELDVSADGSRVVVGKKAGEDGAGNEYRHLYMHIGDSADSVDLMPGSAEGALFDGMTEDGSKVFFTTDESLLSEDQDDEADIYEAEVDPLGNLSLTLISSGGGSQACEPPEEWNTEAGEENCDAMALAGGAGLAADSGTFYFLSPEQLDGSQGTLSQPNLYVVRPGGSPEFVATIDSSIGRPEPPAPARPILNEEFGGIKNTQAVTGSASGDAYVINSTAKTVVRFKANGAPDNYTLGAGAGTNELPVAMSGFSADVAVDDSSGPFSGDLYVAPGKAGEIPVFASSGEQLGSLSGVSNAHAIAVDPANGDVYVADYNAETIYRYEPIASTLPVSNADYNITAIEVPGTEIANLAVDGSGDLYSGEEGRIRKFLPSEFGPSPYPVVAGATFPGEGAALAVDPSTEEIFVGEPGEERVTAYRPSGAVIAHYGQGELPFMRRVGLNPANHHLYVSVFREGFKVTELGYEAVEYHLLANPAVRHAKLHPETHTYSDFQVTPDGAYAAFASAQPLTGFDSNEHTEVFRYEPGGEPTCASCNPTNARATGDSALPSNGLGLLEDGRVFFDSTEAIAPRDLNGKEDAYEWSNGDLQLISTGVSAFASSLLGVDASGRDAYFFTRDTLVPQDNNGTLVKIYDAREEGGFPYTPPPVPCKASDECHGPSSQAPGPPQIGTIRGTSGQYLGAAPAKKKACPRGKVHRRKKCVRKHRRKKHKKARHGRRNAAHGKNDRNG
jgi:sugar lactone lactonase YvrE